MPKFFAVLLTLFFLYEHTMQGQNITGHVFDSLNNPITFASVVATGCKDDQVLVFTNTDTEGRFQLTIKTDCDSITVTARSLGHRSMSFRLALRALPAVRDFVLATTVLEEIVVRGKTPPVIARNDTTEYNMASFSDSTEVTVEDLLKKIPGVSVAENGLITYNGKTVERVLIEGDDLFSQNYTLATRNIRADMISKVQVIDRFQENPLMQGIQQSDRMVMNLKIKPDRKRALSGNVEAGGGYGEAWKGRVQTNLFSLSRKEKIYLIGNANNSGGNILSEVEWTAGGGFQGFGKQQTLQANPMEVQRALQPQSLENAGLPPLYTQANRNGLMYIGFVLPYSSNFKTTISGWLGSVGLQQTASNTTRYTPGNTEFDITEDRSINQLNRTSNLQVESEYFPKNRKNAFRGFFKASNKPIQDNFALLRTQTGSGDFSVFGQSKHNAVDVFGSLEYTYKIRESSVLQFIGKTAFHQGNTVFRPKYDFYGLYFGVDTSFNQLRQSTVQSQGKNIFLGKYLARKNSVQWLAELGLEWDGARFSSDLTLLNTQGDERKPDSSYQHDLWLQIPRYFTYLSATRHFGALMATLRTRFTYSPIRLQSENNTAVDFHQWAAEPQLDLRYSINPQNVLSGYYKFEQELPRFSDLRPNLFFTDYQSINRGLPDLSWLPGHHSGIFHRFNHPIRQYAWHIGGSLTLLQRQLGTEYQINPFVLVSERFRPVQRESFSLKGGANRYFPSIKSRFEIGFTALWMQEAGKLNSQNTSILSQNIYSANFAYGTAFDFWLNVMLSSRTTQILGRNTNSDRVTKSGNHFSTIQLNVRPNKIFDMKLYLHQVSTRTGESPRNLAYASDCIANLRLNKWRSTVEFSAVNLFGSHYFEQVQADAFSQAIGRVTAVQRFFLLTWGLSF